MHLPQCIRSLFYLRYEYIQCICVDTFIALHLGLTLCSSIRLTITPSLPDAAARCIGHTLSSFYTHTHNDTYIATEPNSTFNRLTVALGSTL